MATKRRKFLSVLLGVCALVCTLVFGGVLLSSCGEKSNANTPLPEEETHGLVFTLKEDGTYMAALNDKGVSAVEVPSTYRGKAVTEIGAGADNSALVSVVIPDSVTRIGDNAFYGCGILSSIKLPDTVTYIGNSAFRWCDLSGKFVLPAALTKIGDFAFADCKSLEEIEIPDSVTKIGESAFSGCKSLTHVEIGDSVTSIGESAFAYCDSLRSLRIPFVGTESNN